MHNKFLFWASIFLRFANQWFSCSFCWSQQPFVKVHCMGCSIGLECGRVSFFRQKTRSAMCSWSTIHYLVLSHAHDQLWLKRKIRSGLPSLLEKPYMVKPALSRHLLPCGISACVCFPKVVCVDKCVSNQKWGQRHLEITDWKKNNDNIIISGGSKPSDEGEAQSSTPWQKKGGRVRVAGSQPKNRSGLSLVSK